MVRINGRVWMEPRRDHPQGSTGALATLRAAKGGRKKGKRKGLEAAEAECGEGLREFRGI